MNAIQPIAPVGVAPQEAVPPGMYTHFWDMNSGGKQKMEYKHVFINAPEDVAIEVFKRLFGRDPEHETCSCCGPDYMINGERSSAYVSNFLRGTARKAKSLIVSA